MASPRSRRRSVAHISRKLQPQRPLFNTYCCTLYCPQLQVNLKKFLKVAYNNTHSNISIDGFWDIIYSRWDSASSMLITSCLLMSNNAFDTFYVLMVVMRNNIYGFIKRMFNINNDLIKYNCIDIVNGPVWSSWANCKLV